VRVALCSGFMPFLSAGPTINNLILPLGN